ncbi:MAG: lectin-like protein, partial [Planctomycetota bacterium]
ISYLVNKNQKSVWIGATDSTTEGTWTWDLGTAQSEPFYKGKSTTGITQPGWYSNWNSGEPNDYGSNEDYAELIYSTTTTNARWNDKSNVGSNTRPYVLQKDPGYSVTVLSPMFSTAGTDAIKTIRGYKGLGSYKELAVSVPIPEATCDTYYAMRMAQSDGSEAYKESLTYLLTLSSCEPYVPTGSGESPLLGSSLSSGESMGPALRFFVSMDKQARDQAKYLDGSSTPSFPILSNQAGEHVIYARVLHPSGEFTDYQKTITIVDNPPEQISVDPTRTPLSVGQVAKATIGFEDTNSNDQYMATLDWGDGTAPQDMELGATRLFNPTHAYSKPGRHQVEIKLTDMSTGLWSTATTEIYVVGSGISAGQLQVIGSDQRDQITVVVEPRTTTVVTRLGNGKTTTARYATKDFSSLYVATFDGDDFINIVGGSSIPTRIESGRGND